jgi:hypothetical protein
MVIDDLKARQLETLPELAVLTQKERLFCFSLYNTQFNYTAAMRLAYPEMRSPGRASWGIRKRPRVMMALDKLREIFPVIAEWDKMTSTEYSSKMLTICMEKIDALRGKTSSTQEGRLQNWMRAGQFWKENIDKLHGLLTDRIKSEAVVRVVELEGMSAAELKKLALLSPSNN